MIHRLGFRYRDGKIWIHKASLTPNPGDEVDDKPSWSVDIREVLAMGFVGIAAILLITKGNITESMYLLVGLLGYATGRTVPTANKSK